MCFSGLRGTSQEDIDAELATRPVTSMTGLSRGLSVSDPTKQSYGETTLDDLQEHDAPSYGAAKAAPGAYSPTQDDLRQYPSHQSWHGKKPVHDEWDADESLHGSPKGRRRMSDGRATKDAPYRDIDDSPKAQKKRARWAEMKPDINLRKPKQQEAGRGWQSNSDKQQMAQYQESGITAGKGVGTFVQ